MSNISKNEQKKILIFDINPGNDEITSELIFGKILHAIKKAVVNQYVVFLSHSNLSILKKICLDMDIKNVFIISDAGARIYNNGTNKIIYEKSIPKQMALSTIHTGIIENNLILVSTTNREMSYGYNFSNKVSLSKKHYVKLPYSSDFPKFIEFVNTNDIFSILIFNNNDEYLSDSYEKFIKVSNEWEFELQSTIGSFFIITEQNVNKSRAIKYLMGYLQISNNEDVYYYALNIYDKEILASFKNNYVYQDVVLLSDLKNRKKDLHLDINSLIHSIIKNSNPTN